MNFVWRLGFKLRTPLFKARNINHYYSLAGWLVFLEGGGAKFESQFQGKSKIMFCRLSVEFIYTLTFILQVYLLRELPWHKRDIIKIK